MKVGEIQVGRTYEGKGGRRRTVRRIAAAWPHDRDVDYTDDRGREGYCCLSTFARWAFGEVPE